MLNAGVGTPDGFTTPRKGLFAPRIGFAYRLTNDGKTSIHGGFGFGYTQVGLLQTSNLLSNIPFVQQPTYNATEFTNPAGERIGRGTQCSRLDGTERHQLPATGRQPFATTALPLKKKSLPGGVFAIGYAGMTTQHIFTSALDQNFSRTELRREMRLASPRAKLRRYRATMASGHNPDRASNTTPASMRPVR